MAIAENKMISSNAKKTAQCIRFAILGSMFPVVKEDINGDKFICFMKGTDSVFVSKKPLNTLKYCTNLKNACNAAGVKADLSRYARGMEDEKAMIGRVSGAINKGYLAEDVVVADTVVQMHLREQEMKKNAESVNQEDSISSAVSERLAYANMMKDKLRGLAQGADLDPVMISAVVEELDSDIKHIKSVREKKMLSQFAEEMESGRE